MEMNFSSWNTHCWVSRRLELVPGHPFIQRVCHECGRAFVDEYLTGQRYAIHVAIFKLHRLSDQVTSRWLSEQCPADLLVADDADRQTRFIPKATGNAMPPSPTATANALNAVRNTEYVKGILGQNAPPQSRDTSASSS